MDKYFHTTLYWACDYLSMLGLKVIHISKSGHRLAPVADIPFTQYNDVKWKNKKGDGFKCQMKWFSKELFSYVYMASRVKHLAFLGESGPKTTGFVQCSNVNMDLFCSNIQCPYGKCNESHTIVRCFSHVCPHTVNEAVHTIVTSQ